MSGARVVRVGPRGPEPADVPGGAVVLTPSRRAAAALSVPYVSLSGAAVDDLSQAGWSVAAPLLRWRALGLAVRQEVGGDDVAAWRRALAGPVRELLRLGAVRDAPDGEAPAGVSPASRRAWRVAAAYRAALASEASVDPDAVLIEASRAVRVPRATPWALLGFADLDLAACRYLDAAAAPGTLLTLPPEATAAVRRLADLGWTVEEDARPPSRAGERWAARFLRAGGPEPAADGAEAPVALSFASADDEARWMLARVQRLLAEGTPPEELLVVAGDPAAAGPRLDAVAWELGVPLRIDRPVPLSATAVGGLVGLLAEVVARGAPYETTLRLFRHRLVGGLEDAAWARARATRPVGPDAWTRIDPRAAELDWPERATRADLGARFQRTLGALGLPREGLAPPAAATVGLVLRGVQEACRPESDVVSRRAFLDDVSDLLTLLTVRPPPSVPASRGRAVEVVAPRAAAGARVRHLFVLGMNEGALPADLRDDPVLDFADRERARAAGLELAGAARRAQDEVGAFAAALRAADGQALLGVPKRGGGGALLPSPFLARLGVRETPAPERPPASLEEARRAWLRSARPPSGDAEVWRSARRAWSIELAREGAGPPNVHDGVTGRSLDAGERTFSATSLVDLGQCPFRWFGRYRLHLRDVEEADELVTPLLRGRLWHVALERAVARATAAPGPDVRAEVADALDDAFAEAERLAGVPDPDGPAWRRVRGGELRALQRLVRSDAFVRPGFLPVDVERPFEGTWRGLQVRGVVDRVDEGPDGVELIDYKSGVSAPKGAQRASGRGWIDVQLPLYLEAAAPELGRSGAPATARYLSVRAAATLKSVKPGEGDAELDELAARVRRHLAEGDYRLAPDTRREVCRTCELGPVCRVGPRVERKRDAARTESA